MIHIWPKWACVQLRESIGHLLTHWMTPSLGMLTSALLVHHLLLTHLKGKARQIFHLRPVQSSMIRHALLTSPAVCPIIMTIGVTWDQLTSFLVLAVSLRDLVPDMS